MLAYYYHAEHLQASKEGQLSSAPFKSINQFPDIVALNKSIQKSIRDLQSLGIWEKLLIYQ